MAIEILTLPPQQSWAITWKMFPALGTDGWSCIMPKQFPILSL